MENDSVVPYYYYNNYEIDEIRFIKNKMVVIDRNSVALCIKIRCAEGIDDPFLHPCVHRRRYAVVFWVEPHKIYNTFAAEGFLNPHWNEKATLNLGCPDDFACLNLEVVRIHSSTDPGPSEGYVVVGRAKVPLPREMDREKCGRYALARLSEEGFKPEGFIMLSIELKRLIPRPPPFLCG